MSSDAPGSSSPATDSVGDAAGAGFGGEPVGGMRELAMVSSENSSSGDGQTALPKWPAGHPRQGHTAAQSTARRKSSVNGKFGLRSSFGTFIAPGVCPTRKKRASR